MPTFLILPNREEKSLRHVAIVATFLDDNKPKTSLKKWIRTASNFIYLIQFHLMRQMLAKFSWVESERTVSKFKEEKDNFCVVFTDSIKRAPNDSKEMYKIAWCTCKFVVLSIKTFYFFAVLLPSSSSLVLLSSRNSATMVTWRHTSLYSGFTA